MKGKLFAQEKVFQYADFCFRQPVPIDLGSLAVRVELVELQMLGAFAAVDHGLLQQQIRRVVPAGFDIAFVHGEQFAQRARADLDA